MESLAELHGGSDSRLVAIAAEEYHRAGRGPDAVRVAWDAFSQSPALPTYHQLAENAQRIGDFAPYLATVRAAHKPKRNLMKLLAARGW